MINRIYPKFINKTKMSHTVFNSLFSEDYKTKDDDDDDDYPKLEIDESRDAHYPETDFQNQSPQRVEDETWTTYTYQCLRCKNLCNNLLELRDHSQAIHGVSSGFQCVDCAAVVESLYGFIEHVRGHRPELIQYCPVCDIKVEGTEHTNCLDTFEAWPDEPIPSPQELPKSEASQGKQLTWKEYPWVCQFCTTGPVQDVETLRCHLKDVHRKCFGFKCVDCTTELKSFVQFVNHVKKHRPVLGKRCEFCDFKLFGKNQYFVHIKEHVLEFRCEFCSQFFSSRVEFDIHNSLYNPPKTVIKAPPKFYKKNQTSKIFTCDICGKVFGYANTFENHRAIHTGRKRDQQCDLCGKAFFNKASLNVHKLIHKTKDHVCDICNKSFLSHLRLKNHRVIHNSDKPFKCSKCSRRFRLKYHLRKHICHGGETQYKCQFCNEKFKHFAMLRAHEKWHSVIKPFSCPLCSEQYVNWSDCKNHVQNLHGIAIAKYGQNSQGNGPASSNVERPRKIKDEWAEKMKGSLVQNEPDTGAAISEEVTIKRLVVD